MTGILLLGFLVGMKHALEADHVAAVATLAARAASPCERVRLASVWGAGHAGTILLLGGTVLALGRSLPDGVARTFEGLVGLALVALGLDVLHKLRRRRIHFHRHRHADGVVHFHAHAHADDAAHDGHPHPTLARRALVVGGLHGLAGSAALVVLSLESTRSTAEALAYLATFALGSVAGMAALSAAISVPVRLSAARLGTAWRLVEGALGVVTIALGGWMAAAILP